jgi:hypoxanthine phosphoribosyltransferase
MEPHYKKLHTNTDVSVRIRELAQEIVAEHEGKSPLFVALLRGANPFASLLMFEIARASPEFHPEIAYMMVKTYGDSQTAGAPQIITDLPPSVDVAGRTVIVVDDVLDRGITADFVANTLRERGATDIKLAVLAQKDVERASGITPDYCGFDCGDKWLVGMGMDDASSGNEHYRWLDEIWEIVR